MIFVEYQLYLLEQSLFDLDSIEDEIAVENNILQIDKIIDFLIKKVKSFLAFIKRIISEIIQRIISSLNYLKSKFDSDKITIKMLIKKRNLLKKKIENYDQYDENAQEAIGSESYTLSRAALIRELNKTEAAIRSLEAKIKNGYTLTHEKAVSILNNPVIQRDFRLSYLVLYLLDHGKYAVSQIRSFGTGQTIDSSTATISLQEAEFKIMDAHEIFNPDAIAGLDFILEDLKKRYGNIDERSFVRVASNISDIRSFMQLIIRDLKTEQHSISKKVSDFEKLLSSSQGILQGTISYNSDPYMVQTARVDYGYAAKLSDETSALMNKYSEVINAINISINIILSVF